MILNYLTALITIIVILFLAYIPKRIVGTWINPISIFCTGWGSIFSVYNIFSNIYYEIDLFTWSIFTISFLVFYLSATSFLIFKPAKYWMSITNNSNDRLKCLKQNLNQNRFRILICFVIISGSVFFLVYLKSLLSSHGLNQILFTLLDTRALMKEEGALPGFHYFYFWEMLLPLTTIYCLMYGFKNNFLIFIIAIILTACLILTGAKTNIFKALVWSFIIFTMIKFYKIRAFRLLFISSIFITLGLSIFLFHTSFTGELDDFNQQRNEIIYRFSAQIPTFQSLIEDQSETHSFGKLTFLPITKLIHIFFNDVTVPSHILKFYDVPISFNLATYLDIFYRDFGLLGVVMLPSILGFFSSIVFNLYSINKNSFFLLFLMSIVFLWISASPHTAGFIKPSHWFQIIFLYFGSFFIGQRSKQK